MTDLRARLRGRVLAANALWNLAAQVAPAIVGIVAVPFIVRGLGVQRFGILTLAWMVIGYFSLFDLGLGRAVTKVAAEVLGAPQRSGLNRLVWTAWYLMLAVGLVGAVVLAGLSPWLVNTAIKVPADLRHETLISFYLLAGSVPIVVLTTAVRGLLEADQRFGLVSAVKTVMGLLTFLVPLAVLRFTVAMPVIIALLIAVRLGAALVYAALCYRVVPGLAGPARLDGDTTRRLFAFGAWMTVSNVISPLMDSVDRFFVGAMISIDAVAYYATPFDAVTKLLIIPSAIAGVLFPAFSTASTTDRARMPQLFSMGIRGMFVLVYPLGVVVIAFAPDLLRLWLGPTFAAQSSQALRVLMVGVLANGLAALPFALLQGAGRSDLTGKTHLIEAPLYFALLYGLVRIYGINGAAVAWLARVGADMVILYWLARRSFRAEYALDLKALRLPALFVPLLALGWLNFAVWEKSALAMGLVAAFGAYWWRWEMPPSSRALVLKLIPPFRS